MWKVLLVEDEVFVRASLKKIINWEELGFTIVGEAGNGLEALDLIEKTQPDLIICDIIMPVKNGVELLKEAREAGSDARFVMLSCMNDFEYVQQAMEYGASNYVLKLSMSVKVMTELLQKVEVDLHQRKKQKLQEISQEFLDIYNHIWKSLFNQSNEPMELDLAATPLQDFKEHYLTIFSVLHGPSNFNQNCFESLQLLKDSRRNILHFFTNSGQTTIFCWSTAPQVVLGSPTGDYPYPVAYISVESPYKLVEAWSAVLKRIDNYWYERETGRGLVRGNLKTTLNGAYQIPWDQMHELLQNFEQNNTAKCLEIIETIWASMEEKSLSMYLVKETAIQLDGLFRHINQDHPGEPEDFRTSPTHRQLKELLIENIKDYINKRNWESQQITDHPEINKVLSYINQTYYKEVTLSVLADYVGMDANYLSNLFKKKTGENIIHYIHRIRIDHAKSYLVQTGLPVNEIGEKVGFANDNYFIKIFKRFTDQTPSHYRRVKQ